MTHIDKAQSAKSYFRVWRYDPFPDCVGDVSKLEEKEDVECTLLFTLKIVGSFLVLA